MTLDQFHALKLWHTSHPRPLERNLWDAVLTLWMMGWAGIPAFLLLAEPLAVAACVAAIFLPHRYVAWRRTMHQQGRLRCDWITVLR